jgi:hypothetical protein
MKRAILTLALMSFALGAALLLYDWYFYYRYDADLNDVAGTDGDSIVDWVTGERPAYTAMPAWIYGSALVGLASALWVIIAFFQKRKTKRTINQEKRKPALFFS